MSAARSGRKCYVCGIAENKPDTKFDPARELRPYGQGGKPVCFPCAMHPKRKKVVEANFAARLEHAEGQGGGIVLIGGEDGPEPLGKR